MNFQEMITLVVLSLLLIPGTQGGEKCTKNANTNFESTYFCSGHCCGEPVGDDCCFDGIAQTFTVIAGVVGICLLMISIACWIRTCKKPKSDGRVQPQDNSEDPSSQSESAQTSKRKLGVVQEGPFGPTPDRDLESGRKQDPDSTDVQKLDTDSTDGTVSSTKMSEA